MKRDSKDRSPKGGQADSKPRKEMHGHDEFSRDGSPAGAQSDRSMHALESWSSDDFEAALPLYVGGELDSVEVKRVDAWLASHPEAQKTLAASEAAAGVLARFAQITHQRETPNLWAGIRSELVEQRLLMDPMAPQVSEPGELAPILGGPRWFQRKSVAAAAALLLTGSIGLSMMASSLSGPTMDSVQPASSMGGDASAPVAAATSSAGTGSSAGSPAGSGSMEASSRQDMHLASSGAPLVVALTGTPELPMNVRAVGSQVAAAHPQAAGAVSAGAESARVRGEGQRLERAGPDAERLIDDAPNFLLWQFESWDNATLNQRRVGAEAQLTSGR